MKALRYRAFQFKHPDLDVAEQHAGLQVTPVGKIAMVEENAAVRQAVLLLLTTRPGERVMRPGYGCDLHRLLFSPNDDTTAGLAIHYVRSALETWEPRVELLSVDANRNDEDNPGQLDVTLEYRVRATQARDQISIVIELSGEGR